MCRARHPRPTGLAKYLGDLRKSAQGRVAVLNSETDKVKFGVIYGLVPSAWEDTYNKAVAAGAIDADDKARKDLKEALTKLEVQLGKIKTGKTPADKFKEFLELSKKIEAASDAIGYVRGLNGADNPVFTKYLTRVEEMIRDLDKNAAVASVIDGSALGDLKKVAAFVWKDSDWQKVKKEGIAAGLFPDSKTGIGAAIDAGEKAVKDWEKNAKGTDAKKTEKSKEAAGAALISLKGMLTTQLDRAKMVSKPNLIAYLTDARSQCEARLVKVKGP
jgi:hypothetical protein